MSRLLLILVLAFLALPAFAQDQAASEGEASPAEVAAPAGSAQCDDSRTTQPANTGGDDDAGETGTTGTGT